MELEHIFSKARPARTVHRPDRPAGPQRNPVLSAAGREPRTPHAHHLYPDRRPGLPAIQPHLPPPARLVPLSQRPRPDRPAPPQFPPARHPPHRGHRQRAHPRPGRSGRRRHGHSHRQAGPLLRRRGHPSLAHPAHQPGRRHRQQRAARRPVLSRLPRAPAARPGIRRLRRGIRASGEERIPARAACSGRISRRPTPSACSDATRGGCPASTTTSRAPRPSRWPASFPGCASPGSPCASNGSCWPARAPRASALAGCCARLCSPMA